MTSTPEPDMARNNLIGYCLAAIPNEVAFERADRLADLFRAEVLREAADALEARVADVDVDTRTTWAGMDAKYLRWMANEAEKKAAVS